LWLTAWNNDRNESAAKRLAWFKSAASKDRFAEQETTADNLIRYSYRLRDRNDDGPVESLNALVIGDDGHLQLSVYFDDPSDEGKARQMVDSVARRHHA
jgi:hypothetical protein